MLLDGSDVKDTLAVSVKLGEVGVSTVIDARVLNVVDVRVAISSPLVAMVLEILVETLIVL